MAVVFGRGDRFADDEHAEVIIGRPDLPHRGGPLWGSTVAKKHPPYVFGIRGASCLVHKVLRVELHWYRVGGHGHKLVKLKRPLMVAHTNCSQFFRLTPETARTCHIPSPDALLCGRCHGDGATFPKAGRAYKSGLSRREAHVKLGCVIAGY